MVYELYWAPGLWLVVFGLVCTVGVSGYLWQVFRVRREIVTLTSVDDLRYRAQCLADEVVRCARNNKVPCELRERILFYPTYILIASQNNDKITLERILIDLQEDRDALLRSLQTT